MYVNTITYLDDKMEIPEKRSSATATMDVADLSL